jgi:hypothetical protein
MITVLTEFGSRRMLNQAKPILGFSDTETVMIDFDNTLFKQVKRWALRTTRFHRLEGFLILRSSKNSYHVVFNRRVSWSENMRIVAWVSLLSGNEKLKKYFLMQCIKQSSTLRLSPKGEKGSPRVVYRFGKQDAQIHDYLCFRGRIKRIQKRLAGCS